MTQKILFADFCRDVLGEPISQPWIVAYKLLDGEPLTSEETEVALQLCGAHFKQRERRELVAIKGRRSQGTKTACKYLLWKIHTCGTEFRRYAAARDRLTVPIVCQAREVSREAFTYLTGFYDGSRFLGRQVIAQFAESIELRNGFVLTVQTCSYRAPRGITAPLALLDEVGVWRVEGSDIDREVYRSLRPAMVQFPNRRLIVLGTPWVKAGLLFQAWQRRSERGDRLVIHAPTSKMNPLISREELETEREADPENFRREFEGEWLANSDSLLAGADIDAAIMPNVREIPPADGLHYVATIDASGLAGRDRFTFAVGHSAKKEITTDLLRSWSKQTPGLVCEEIGAICKAYRVSQVLCDQFGFAFLRELMRQHGIDLHQLPFTTRSKPEIFISLKLALSQGKLRLLDHGDAIRELRWLESRRTSSGHVSISAPRGRHDDLACVLALLAHQIGRSAAPFGVLEFFRNLREGKIKLQQQAPEPSAQEVMRSIHRLGRELVRRPSPPPQANKQEQPGVCPDCGSKLLVRICDFFRCQQCGTQIPIPGGIPVQRVSRADASRRNYRR